MLSLVDEELHFIKNLKHTYQTSFNRPIEVAFPLFIKRLMSKFLFAFFYFSLGLFYLFWAFLFSYVLFSDSHPVIDKVNAMINNTKHR